MMTSIRVNLLKWLITPLLAVNLFGAVLTYLLAWTPAQIAFDQSLTDAAWDLLPHIRATKDRVDVDLSNEAEQMLRVNHVDAIFFVVRDSARRVIAGDSDFPPLLVPEKFNDPHAYNGIMRGQPIRIITMTTMVGAEQILIGVAETLTKRRGIQFRILLTLLLLEGVLVIISVVIVWLAVTSGLFPLQKMRAQLDSRSPDDLSPITDDDVPLELKPVIKAISGLLNRAQNGAIARQDFLANVAHQLRTPLAGFKTQLEWLQQKYADEPETARSANLMMSSTERMVRQTNQLLSLARAEPSQFEKNRLAIVDLDKLVEESIQHFVQEADKKDIDLGFDLRPTKVLGDRFLLRDLVDNLIDNAIRYSPQNGAVTVSCFQNNAIGAIAIEDSGPGIPASDREKIFNRFYRLDDKVAGSGLGLTIVRDIAKDHDATIIVKSGPEGKGTIFRVEFPLSR
jgi:two-component system sensor histidine kinase TctE